MSYVGDIHMGAASILSPTFVDAFDAPKQPHWSTTILYMNVTLANCLYIFKQCPITSLSEAICLLQNWWLEHIAGLFYQPTRFHHTWFLIVWIPQRRYRSQYIFKEENATFVHIVKSIFLLLLLFYFLETRYTVYFINSQDSLWWQRMFKLTLKIVCELSLFFMGQLCWDLGWFEFHTRYTDIILFFYGYGHRTLKMLTLWCFVKDVSIVSIS